MQEPHMTTIRISKANRNSLVRIKEWIERKESEQGRMPRVSMDTVLDVMIENQIFWMTRDGAKEAGLKVKPIL